MQILRSPLNLYIIWHPNFTRGQDYANYLYSELCRDYKTPLSRGIGIPIFFRSVLTDNDQPLDINFEDADRNAIIVLVDDEMFGSDVWTKYFKDVASNEAKNKRIFPVALSKYAYDVAPEIKDQFIRLQDITDTNETIEFEKRSKKLRSELLNDLSRLLFNINSSANASLDISPPPVKLFISHAKLDGVTMAMDFRNYIRSETKLNSFFDANDIANGYDFENEIAGGVKNSVLVVFQTDAYSTREWCRIEIITAKRYKSPIVVVNAIMEGEKRAFPYIGNAPTIRWRNNFDDIIDLALLQMLNNLYEEQMLKKYIELFDLDKTFETAYLTSPPELFNFLDIKKMKEEKGKKILVIYPDPPLGNEEVKLLNELDEAISFVTPLLLPNFQISDMMEKEINIAGASQNILGTADKSILGKRDKLPEELLFSGKKIGISISDSPDLLKLGFSPMHLQDAAIEFARYLLVHGATLVYGGDLRKDGFTNLFSELSKLYSPKETFDQFHFVNYFAWPIYLKLTKSDELDFRQNKVDIKKISPPGTVSVDPAIPIAPDTNENKTIWAKSISYMRQTMNENCDARIFLGGQVQNFRGKYPGIIEEAYLALSKNIPVYFVGTYGGATKEIINLVTNQPANTLNETFQFSDKGYEDFYNYWNNSEDDKIDYEKLCGYFSNYGLKKISEHNGLDEEENERLFTTNNLPEMIYYVLKGLTAIQS